MNTKIHPARDGYENLVISLVIFHLYNYIISVPRDNKPKNG